MFAGRPIGYVRVMGRCNMLLAALLGLGCGKTGSGSDAPGARPPAEPVKLAVECEGGGQFLLQIADGRCERRGEGSKIVGQCDGSDGSHASAECVDGGVACTRTAKTGCCAVGNADKPPQCAVRPST